MTASDGTVYAHYMTARQVMRMANGELPLFEVTELGQALSLNCFAATPKQCQKHLLHLCVVMCIIG